MLNVKLVCVGSLKEKYLRDAIAEYEKRLSAFCKFETLELKEQKLPENPSEAHIAAALEEEAERILRVIPPKSYKMALCVEGKQLPSEALAQKIDAITASHGSLTLIIGSSHGLSDKVKNAADFKLSVSALTFPHQLMRVMLLEILYRCENIIKGTKYHK